MYVTFDSVIEYYHQKAEESNLLSFAPKYLGPIKEWLEKELSLKTGKDNLKSVAFRKQGNVFYKEKRLRKCLECYNSSVCYAEDSSEAYFLALANRSAVTYELEKYEDSLKDIELCLNSSTYPEKLRSKLNSRKTSCISKLGKGSEITISIEKLVLCSEEAHLNELSSTFENGDRLKIRNEHELPLFEDGENPDFAYASSKIGIRYDSLKGRHVIAKQNITKGSTLFIETAFAFGGIFNEQSKTMNMLKCYYCLKDSYSGVPCEICAKCLFCNPECKNKSWQQSHRWECKGMLGNVWYHLGIAFPAFKAFMKGISSNFQEIRQKEWLSFGNKNDNYPFFNSLLYHETNMHLDVSIMAVMVSTYLNEYTNFFDWLLTQIKNENWNIENIVNFFESQLVKHILQFQNNSSIIEHWIEEEPLPLDKEPVACGIFPSVSIMNHSCKPNIANYFICDTIVVKALEDIKENEEISNCYGIYYRNMSKKERRKNCNQLYGFECRCEICSDPTKEMDYFDSLRCPNCGLNIPNLIKRKSNSLCKNCGISLDYKILNNMYRSVDLNEDENDAKSLHRSLNLRKKLLNRYHTDLQNNYFKLYRFYDEKENYELMLDYFEEWLSVEKIKIGQDIQLFGFLLYELSSNLLTKLDTNLMENRKLVLKAKNFMKDAIRICMLHYPPNIIDKMLMITQN